MTVGISHKDGSCTSTGSCLSWFPIPVWAHLGKIMGNYDLNSGTDNISGFPHLVHGLDLLDRIMKWHQKEQVNSKGPEETRLAMRPAMRR